MPRCGGCEGVCRCSVEGTDCISVTGSGQAASPYVVDAAISADVGNSVECRGDGLYVGAEVVAGLNVGAGIGGDGTAPTPLILAPPMAQVVRSTAQSIPNAVTTVCQFLSSIDFDTHGMFTPYDRLVAPVDGIYLAHLAVEWEAAPDGEYRLSYITINGSTAKTQTTQLREFAAFTAPQMSHGDLLVSLSAGDFIDVRLYQLNPGAVNRSVTRALMSLEFRGPDTTP